MVDAPKKPNQQSLFPGMVSGKDTFEEDIKHLDYLIFHLPQDQFEKFMNMLEYHKKARGM